MMWGCWSNTDGKMDGTKYGLILEERQQKADGGLRTEP